MSRSELIVADYKAGMNQTAIGLKHGLSQSSISGYIKRAGLGKPRNNWHATMGEGDDYFVEPYRVMHPTIRELVAIKPFPRMRLTTGRRY
jgi:hypothetical protein